ncbi:hypothetical protein NYR30_00275 [Gallibacterium salpingitidis]|uniref:hypothetical protein n=1 Tax=Gallibacterium salpingitidis TaxID=505341 RepID=UPI0026702DE9|nr:hypothetical protein [Gallibacterium salpingitidis]WKS99769.1 hypothetical protein NYR30_00275 [Gallibacterium salpingitidis]
MKLARCPICHSDIHLDQLLEDDAGRELLTLIAKCNAEVARPLVAYISLFRPEKSALSNSRAVKLIKEVLALYPQSLLLAHALSETVQSVQNKRRNNQNTAPLTNHNYLKQVYETNAPKFVSTQVQVNDAEQAEVKVQAEQQEKMNAILAIEQLHKYGREIWHLPAYPDWVEWKKKQKEIMK